MKQKFVKLALILSAAAGIFLLASIPNFSTRAIDRSFWVMTEDEVTVDKAVQNFGTIKESIDTISTVFTITNNSKGSVVITHVGTSCGCTVPEWTKEPIEPGKTGEVTVTYHTKGRIGPFDKTITITTTGNPERIAVEIKGTVEASKE